jgi:glycosidase
MRRWPGVMRLQATARAGLQAGVRACRQAGLLAALLAQGAAQAATCQADPLEGRALYLRGSFNAWAAAEGQRFTWACDRWSLVVALKGEQAFKVADEAWSADADFGLADGAASTSDAATGLAAPLPLQRRGREIRQRFAGTYRMSLLPGSAAPTLRIDTCIGAEAGAPLGDTQLFLRGTLNNWAAQDDYAFQYSCDAYYLNIKASGRYEFKVADAGWNAGSSFGSTPDNQGNFSHEFSGEHTVRLGLEAGRPQLSVGPKTFADPRAKPVADPVALSLRFDSRSTSHKRPFGAVKAGTTIDFSVSALPGVARLTLVVEKRRLEGNQEVLEYREVARLPMQRLRRAAAAGALERFSAAYRFVDVSVYGYWFEAEIGGRLYALQNNGDVVFWTREKGSGGVAAVADKPATALAQQAIRRFRQTVYSPAFKVPDWAPDVVYYYVFPERFRNGNKSNDPQPGVAKVHQHTVELHQDWNERPYRPGSGDGSDAHYNNDFFGGDLAGLIEKLDYIKALGANAIYMTPVFRAASNHKYDTADYKNIDPGFGSNDDFMRLTKEAARRGIRVIPDTSLNHTGADSPYFDRYGNFAANGRSEGAFANAKVNPASPYANWYSFDPTQPTPDKQYKGWVGVADLPELNKANAGLRDYFYRAPDSVMKLWLDRGASGWRMDVAPWVPDDFWREWRSAIKAHRPDALTIAETWFDASKYFLGDMFDSTMNYIFRNAVLDYAAGGKAKLLYQNIELMREAYPPQAFYALMNLLSTHDQARALHHFGWHDDKPGASVDASVVALAKQRLRLAVFFQMTFPGAPTVYYGDEVGLGGGDDPDNRRTYPWADLGGQPDTALLADFKRLIKLRHDHAVLRRGSIDAPLYIDDNVVVLLRRLGSQWALTAMNNAAQARTVEVALPAAWSANLVRDALAGDDLAVHARRITLRLPALSGKVWLAP